MDKKISVLWLIPTALISGIIGFFTTYFEFFKFNAEISILDFLSLIISSSIGIYLATTIQKSAQASSYEKKILMDIVYSVYQKVKPIQQYLLDDNLIFDMTNKHFKFISSAITELETHNEICKLIDASHIEELRNSFFQVKKIITGSSTNDASGIKIFNISNDHKSMAENQLEAFKKKLITVTLVVNRR